jgi:pSer/pThr/pTyr-binding forkhead associated (FHA) protein
LSQERQEKSSAVSNETIVVEVMNGPEDGRLVPCEKAPITIGRAPDNAVHLSFDHLISRHHARILRQEKTFVLSDLKSTNGTFIGRKRIRKDAPIHPHMLFRVGATLLRIRLSSPDEMSQK